MSSFDLTKLVADQFSKISKKDLVAYFSVAFFSFLSFGQFAIDITYNNDGLGRMIDVAGGSLFNWESYLNGFTKGRWAYPFFANLYNSITYLPYFVTIISIFLFVLISIVIWRLFKVESLLQKILVGGLICSSPIFVHYFFYSGDGEVYATGILLMSLAVYLFTRQENFKKILGIILSIISLACYPALFAYSTGLICLYSIYMFFQKETLRMFFLKTFKILLMSFISLIMYFVITKVMVNLLGLEMTSYKNAGDISPIELIKNIPNKIALSYSLFVHFLERANLFVKAYLLIISILLIYTVFKKNIKQLPFILTVFIATVPLIFIMYIITYEVKPYPGFQFGFIPLLALLHIPLVNNKSTWIKNIILILPLVVIFINVKTTNQIIMKYRLNCESSRILTFNMVNEIQKHPSFNSTKKIALIGEITENDNFKHSKYIPKTVVLNGMHFPVSFSGSNTWFKFKNQIKLQGFDFEFANQDEINNIYSFFENQYLPEFPKKGSVFEYKDCIVLNIGSKE